MKHDPATKERAKALFGQGWRLALIARELGVTEKTLRAWRDAEGWAPELGPEQALEARLAWLILKDDKTQGDWQELKQLNEVRNKMLRRAQREQRGDQGAAARKRGGRGGKNEIGGIDLARIAGPPLFGYQREFLADAAPLRFYVKSRQIGFTWGASWGALTDAIESGRNQIFLSASKNQVGVFRDYIRAMALEYLSLELEGNKDRIELHRDGAPWATLYFLSTNTATAQSYHGNVWIDEACWIPRYAELRKVAGGMAAQKRYRLTIFSTPSTVIHAAWQEFQRLQKEQHQGKRGRVSLRTITLHEAMAGGCDLFDLEQLREEDDTEAFAQLFECQPLDDELGIFKLAELEALQRDVSAWKHPGQAPVWIGYDPSRTTDSASLIVAVKLPPTDTHPLGKIRLQERASWTRKSYRWQAERLRDFCGAYNVEHIAIDTPGMGGAVFELVREFFPKATAINYSLESKVELVNAMRHLANEGRLELPAGDTFLLHSFLAIKQTTTGGGRITYKAGRTAETGHADAFFAAAHACHFEPLRPRRRHMLYA